MQCTSIIHYIDMHKKHNNLIQKLIKKQITQMLTEIKVQTDKYENKIELNVFTKTIIVSLILN